MKGADDEELARLMRAATAGDEKAYAGFLRRAADVVDAFLRRRVEGSGIDREDIVQETLLAIHVKRHTWRSDGPVMPWVYAIARHKLVDAFRRRGQRIEIDIDDVAGTIPQPAVDTINDRDIRTALASLAPGQRSVVSAISVDGRSIGQTAASLGMSETAVRVALHRGLSAIARKFGQS